MLDVEPENQAQIPIPEGPFSSEWPVPEIREMQRVGLGQGKVDIALVAGP